MQEYRGSGDGRIVVLGELIGVQPHGERKFTDAFSARSVDGVDIRRTGLRRARAVRVRYLGYDDQYVTTGPVVAARWRVGEEVRAAVRMLESHAAGNRREGVQRAPRPEVAKGELVHAEATEAGARLHESLADLERTSDALLGSVVAAEQRGQLKGPRGWLVKVLLARSSIEWDKAEAQWVRESAAGRAAAIAEEISTWHQGAANVTWMLDLVRAGGSSQVPTGFTMPAGERIYAVLENVALIQAPTSGGIHVRRLRRSPEDAADLSRFAAHGSRPYSRASHSGSLFPRPQQPSGGPHRDRAGDQP